MSIICAKVAAVSGLRPLTALLAKDEFPLNRVD